MPKSIASSRIKAPQNWTEGSIVGNLWLLSWPIAVGAVFNTVGPTIDMIWVGKLGAAAIAGVGVSSLIVDVVNTMLMGLYTGVRAMIARFVGSHEKENANLVAQQALVISGTFSISMALIGIFLAEWIIKLTGVTPEVVSEGAAYLRIQFCGVAAQSFRMVNDSVMQASGDSKTPMVIAIVFRVFHIALCPFLVFGWWAFPRWGVSGAALTNVVSQGLGTVLGLWILFKGRSHLRLTFKNFRINRNICWRLVKIGLPASIMGMERSFASLFLVWFVAPFGTVAVAAHSLMQRLAPFLHMPGMGFGQGAGVLAGQNLGAGQPKRAEKTGWSAVGLITCGMIIPCLAILLWNKQIIGVFNADADLIRVGSTFLKIEIINCVFFGMAMGFQQILNGVGDTLIPMIVLLFSVWGIQVPLAATLPKTSLGVYGVRWAMSIAMAIRGIIYSFYFRTGRWKRKQV
jgi:putative MATE family efflux protein